MGIFSIILTILGLSLFEVTGSVDNAIINAQVLSSMQQKAKKWFLTWGIFSSVFLVRGVLPWLIIWLTTPSLGPVGALTATFSSNPLVHQAILRSSPLLFMGGGIFLVLLFLNWLFLEEKNYGVKGEEFIYSQGIWFYALASLFLTGIIYIAIKVDPLLALAATVGSSAFFLTHGFKENAQKSEKRLINKVSSDLSKILFLEIIDATFSIDEVLGAFAFTLSVPLILIGNGIGAVVVRQLTVSNIEKIKKYIYLENGAMYSIFFLGIIMLLNSFGFLIPEWFSPIVTFLVVGYFFLKSRAVSAN
ncbi:DUF475 domain-containing protein [Candidatus Daviesbacteria bacterium]|nr:DUF475 domain-containing protein [Candidatus Daviesbacteria bacterium]